MGIEGINKGLHSVNNIIHSVRDMYVYNKKKKRMDIKSTSLLECINKAPTNFDKTIDENNIELKIKDYGIEMPSEVLKNLFDNQKTTSRIGTASEKGTGLGMIIAKSMLDKMNSHIQVNSSISIDDSWTEYRIKLPQA